jgi:hypothetical protein
LVRFVPICRKATGKRSARRLTHSPELVALTAEGESASLPTPDMLLHRNNRRYVPAVEVDHLALSLAVIIGFFRMG